MVWTETGYDGRRRKGRLETDGYGLGRVEICRDNADGRVRKETGRARRTEKDGDGRGQAKKDEDGWRQAGTERSPSWVVG